MQYYEYDKGVSEIWHCVTLQWLGSNVTLSTIKPAGPLQCIDYNGSSLSEIDISAVIYSEFLQKKRTVSDIFEHVGA